MCLHFFFLCLFTKCVFLCRYKIFFSCSSFLQFFTLFLKLCLTLIKSHFAVRENSDDWCQLHEKERKKIPATAAIQQQQKTTSTTTTTKKSKQFFKKEIFLDSLTLWRSSCDVDCVYLKEIFSSLSLTRNVCCLNEFVYVGKWNKNKKKIKLRK